MAAKTGRDTEGATPALVSTCIAGFRVQGSGGWVQGAGFRVQGSGLRVEGSEFRVQGSGIRVQGSGFGHLEGFYSMRRTNEKGQSYRSQRI